MVPAAGEGGGEGDEEEEKRGEEQGSHDNRRRAQAVPPLAPSVREHYKQKEAVRFDSIGFGSGLSKIRRFSWFDAVRPAFSGHVVARSGSVRFGSTSGSGRFQN